MRRFLWKRDASWREILVIAAAIALVASLIGAGDGFSQTPIGPFWHIEKKTYRCAGTKTYVICHSSPRLNDEAPYRAMLDGRHLWVSFGGKLIYECWVRSAPGRCRMYP